MPRFQICFDVVQDPLRRMAIAIRVANLLCKTGKLIGQGFFDGYNYIVQNWLAVNNIVGAQAAFLPVADVDGRDAEYGRFVEPAGRIADDRARVFHRGEIAQRPKGRNYMEITSAAFAQMFQDRVYGAAAAVRIRFRNNKKHVRKFRHGVY